MICYILLENIIRPGQSMEENYLNLLYWILSGGAISFASTAYILYKDKKATEEKFQTMQIQTLQTLNSMNTVITNLTTAIDSLKDSLHPRV